MQIGNSLSVIYCPWFVLLWMVCWRQQGRRAKLRNFRHCFVIPVCMVCIIIGENPKVQMPELYFPLSPAACHLWALAEWRCLLNPSNLQCLPVCLLRALHCNVIKLEKEPSLRLLLVNNAAVIGMCHVNPSISCLSYRRVGSAHHEERQTGSSALGLLPWQVSLT